MSITDPDSNAGRSEGALVHLDVLLVYEDAATARRGMQAVEHVLKQRKVQAEGHFHVWRQDMLGDPSCQAEAARDALDADIMVLSAHGVNRLPAAAESNLKDWVGFKRGSPCALVLSLDADAKSAAESNPTLRRLRSEAEHNGLSVLLHFGEAPCPGTNAAIADIHRRAHTLAPILEQILHQPGTVRRWDIDE